MSMETAVFLDRLACARERAIPCFLQKAASLAYMRRWSRMLGVSAASSVAASFLLSNAGLRNSLVDDGDASWLMDLQAEVRFKLQM